MPEVVLVTGGAGFIGCEISPRLANFGLPVIAVDNLHPQIHPDGKRPGRLPDSVELAHADIQDVETWDRLLDRVRPKIVVHLAAETGTGQSLTEASRHAGVNVLGTARMLDAFSSRNIRPDHILLCSSRAVYGEGAWLDQNGLTAYPIRRPHEALIHQRWIPELRQHPLASPLVHNAAKIEPRPVSVYGATKLTQEHILEAWCAALNVPLSILRLQNVYGPGQSPFNAYTGIITLFHRLARSGQRIEVYEDGDIGRDFVYISDVADAIIASLASPPEHEARLLDVGSGIATTIMQAARFIAGLHDAPEPAICGKFRDGDVRWACADPGPLAREIGVSAKIGFAAGCKLVGDWLVEKGYA